MCVLSPQEARVLGSVLSSTTSHHEPLAAVPLSSLSFNFPICKRRGFKEISPRIPFKLMYIKFIAYVC